jgi:hypothetical protein
MQSSYSPKPAFVHVLARVLRRFATRATRIARYTEKSLQKKEAIVRWPYAERGKLCCDKIYHLEKF